MNISKPISTATRLQATFTSSADPAPERAGKPIHATLSLDPGLHRRLKLAAATQGVSHDANWCPRGSSRTVPRWTAGKQIIK